MAEAAEKPPARLKGAQSIPPPSWALHLAVLLSVLIALQWVNPRLSPSPAPEPNLEATTVEIKAQSEPSPMPPYADLVPTAELGQSLDRRPVRRLEGSRILSALATPTALPQMGQWRPTYLLTSRGGIRPTVAPFPFILIPNPVPHTTIPDRPRLTVITYTVQAGDTLMGIAERFGLDANTIAWANSSLEGHPDLLQIGQVLTILPVDGIYHTVKKGETLEGIAKLYKVSREAIIGCAQNNLHEPYTLTVGQKLIVPGAKKPYVPPKVVHEYVGEVPTNAAKGSGILRWPANGLITQRYRPGVHNGVDIAAPKGTPILAADAGYVAETGSSRAGYGKYVVIEHGNGFQTLYAHLNSILVSAGESVSKGQQIGTMGMTGKATGSHLHFEVRYKGAYRNPFGYLP